MIYTFNARDFLMYPIMKSYFNLNYEDIYTEIQNSLDKLKRRMVMKGISYDELKGALIPNQEKNKFETCFVFDSRKIVSNNYEHYIFEKFIPFLDKESTYSVLCGNYVDFIYKYQSNSQLILHSAISEVLEIYNHSKFTHSSNYYLIYINRLTKRQRLKIVEGLKEYSWFTGFADVTYGSKFKTYIANILVDSFIKNKDKIISRHPSDYFDSENINILGYPFDSNGFDFFSINEYSYSAFLSYKIESEVPDEDDIGFSFNAIFPLFDSFDKLIFDISDEKWYKYITNNEDGKGDIIKLLGYDLNDKNRFIREIFKKISANYIYNMRKNEYGALLFNVCIELMTINGNFRKTTVALKYNPDVGTINLITIT